MSAESNTSFHQEYGLGSGSGLHRYAISFRSGTVNNTSEMIPVGNDHRMIGNSGHLMFSDNSSSISSSSPSNTTLVASSSGLDSVPGLKHDAGLDAEWTKEEQYRLEEGLVKYKDEHSIMKYVKIAALLRDKNVRDVALRCRWMMRKRRKQEDTQLRKANFRKDKFGESSAKNNLPSTSIPSMKVTSYAHQPPQVDLTRRVKSQVLTSKAKQLLEQNVQALNLINGNLTLLKLQDNIDLFYRTRDNISNITAIINDMRKLSGKIGQMLEFPISIDQNLADILLPRTTLRTQFWNLKNMEPSRASHNKHNCRCGHSKHLAVHCVSRLWSVNCVQGDEADSHYNPVFLPNPVDQSPVCC